MHMEFEPQPITPVHFPESLREQMRQHAVAAYSTITAVAIWHTPGEP